MRIAIVSPFDPEPDPATAARAHVGGVERVLGEFSKTLAQGGHDVTLVCSHPARSGEERRDGFRVVHRRRRGALWRSPVARLSRAIPEDADVVHVPATYPFTTNPSLRRARRLGAACVLDFHFEPRPPGSLARLAALAYRAVAPRAYAKADLVVVRSLEYAKSAPSLARVPAGRLRVVPNGVDVRTFRPHGPGHPDGPVLFVGRLVPYKGVDALLRAARLMRPPRALQIVGDGPSRGALEQLAHRLGVRAEFLGHVPDADLPGLYGRAAVTVLPSLNAQEAFGLSLLESMACGTPVVASDLPGVSALARLGGLVSPPDHASTLAAQIERACRPGFLPRGERLAAAVRDGYSWEAVTDRLVRVYREALARRRDGDAGVSSPADPLGQPVL